MALSGVQRVALILSSIDSKKAARVLRHLPEETVTRIGRQMVSLSPESLSRDEIEATAKKFVRDFRNYAGPAADPGLVFSRILRESFSEDDAETILQRIQEEATPGVRALEEIDPKQISAVLETDHPQVVALVLSRMAPGPAARVLDSLSADRRTEVCRRLASMPAPSAELVRRVITAVMSKVFRASTAGSSSGTSEGVRNVAIMLKSIGPEAAKEMISKIAAENAEMAKAIQLQMFTFEDVKMLGKKDIQKVLSQISVETLALAIKGVDEELEEMLMNNVSQRIADQVKEEREILGAVSVGRVKEAQATIRDKVWEYVESGEIVLRGAEEEQVV